MKNEIRIKISGLNLSRIINYLIDKGVLLNDVVVKSKFVIFSISQKDKLWLDKVCDYEHKKYQILHRYGIINVLSRLPFYLGSVVALIVTFSYLIAFYFIVFDVVVVNDTSIDYNLQKVNILLDKSGVSGGISRFEFDAADIENILLNGLDDISGCSVKYNGSILKIKIYPSIKKNETNNVGLYSKYDAMIEWFEVYSGVGNYKVGQIVKKGDLLVESDGDASASIKGKVYFSSTRLYNKRQEKMVYSGRYEVLKDVYIFNKMIINGQKQCTFSNYLVKKCDFYLTNNYLLPIKVKEFYCFEYALEEEIVEFEVVENRIKQEIYEETIAKMPLNAEILDCTYSVVSDGDYTRVDCFIETILDLV